PVPVFFRFMHKHVYATIQTPDGIAKDKILTPAAVLPAGRTGVLSLSVRLDQIPEGLRKTVAGQLELQLETAKQEKLPDETETMRVLKAEVIDTFAKHLTSVINDGKELALRVDLDQKAGEMSIELALSGQDGSGLSKTIAGLGE